MKKLLCHSLAVMVLVAGDRAHHTGYQLVMQSTRVLLDETLPNEELEEIRRCVREHRGDIITGYHRLRARRAGSRRHVDLHVTVDPDLTVTEAHDIAEHIEDDIRACIPNTTCWFTWSRGRPTGSRATERPGRLRPPAPRTTGKCPFRGVTLPMTSSVTSSVTPSMTSSMAPAAPSTS